MSACPSFDRLLVLPHLQVQNANAVSSPLTHGFPSITAFLGLMWALERKTRKAGLDIRFKAVGVVCHAHQEQVAKGSFINWLSLTRNPIGRREQKKLISEDGKADVPAFVEEGRIHLQLSLVFAVRCERWSREPERQEQDVATVANLLAGMRIAGGSLLAPRQAWRYRYRPQLVDMSGTDEDRAAKFRRLCLRLLPGFTLVARDDLIDKRLAELQVTQPSATRLDAWLSLSRINWRYGPDGASGKGEWTHDRGGLGWVVPIPVGYGAISDLHAPGTVANARDADTPFRFVESLYSAGQWVSPHRIKHPGQLLWYADSRPEQGLYRCRNDYIPAPDPFESEYDFS